MAKQKRIGNNPLAWITSTADPAAQSRKKGRTDSVAQPAEREPVKAALSPAPEPVPEPAPEPAPKAAAPAALLTTAVAVQRAPAGPKLTLSNKRGAASHTAEPAQAQQGGPDQYHLVCVTAKTEDALAQRLQDLSDWLRQEGAHHDLTDMAFTLLIGRSHFNVRTAFVVNSREALANALQQVLLNGQSRNCLMQKSKPGKPDPQSTELGNQLLAKLASGAVATNMEREAILLTLAEKFVNRYNLDWAQLFVQEECHRIPMPTYPFAKERCWLPGDYAVQAAPAAQGGPESEEGTLFYQRNTSNVDGLRFTAQLRGNEFYLTASPGLPGRCLWGAVFPEMVRAAGALAAERVVSRLQHLVWSKPTPVGVNDNVHTHLVHTGDPNEGALAFEVATGDNLVHCQGTLVFATAQAEEEGRIDLAAVRERCRRTMSGAEHYRQIGEVGYTFGGTHQAIRQWHGGEREALALLELPTALARTVDDCILHPVLVEGALQTAWRLAGAFEPSSGRLPLPYSVREIDIKKPLGRRCYAYVTYVDGKQRVQWCSEAGELLADMKDFVSKALPARRSPGPADAAEQSAGGLEP